MKKANLFILTGPTASGKSKIIAGAAREYPIEVISADSRQVYRHMPIGTAQPTQEEQTQVKHHLISCVDPSQKYSAGAFARYCKEEIPRIISRGSIPFIVGGTYFYIDALLHGLLREPDIPSGLREEIESLPADKVQIRLREVDPASAKKIHPHNIQRLKRALLVSLATDQPFSSFQREGGIEGQYSITAWVLDMPRENLYERINERTRKMLEAGWIDEAKALLDGGYDAHSPGLQSLGYPEIVRFLKQRRPEDKEIAPSELTLLCQEIAQKTRNFAKRQLTWFRSKNILKKIDYTHARYSIAAHMKNLSEA